MSFHSDFFFVWLRSMLRVSSDREKKVSTYQMCWWKKIKAKERLIIVVLVELASAFSFDRIFENQVWGSKLEILSRIAQATAALTRLKPVWNDKSVSLSPKIRLMHPLPYPPSCMLVNHGLSQQSCKEEYKLWKWGATQHTWHLIQRPHYQWGSLCQDPTGNQTTQRSPDHCKETQTEVVWVWTCLSFIRSD